MLIIELNAMYMKIIILVVIFVWFSCSCSLLLFLTDVLNHSVPICDLFFAA